MFLHAITGVCTPVCLFTSRISVEAVTPPEQVRLSSNNLLQSISNETMPQI